MFLLAAEISAPESGRALVWVEPLGEVMLMLTLVATMEWLPKYPHTVATTSRHKEGRS